MSTLASTKIARNIFVEHDAYEPSDREWRIPTAELISRVTAAVAIHGEVIFLETAGGLKPYTLKRLLRGCRCHPKSLSALDNAAEQLGLSAEVTK